MAKAANLFNVGVPCKHGHTTGRYVVSRKCVTCAIDAASKWNKANKAAHTKHSVDWAARNSEQVAEYNKRWREENADKIVEKNASWNAANEEKWLAISRGWKKRNKAHVRFLHAKRRAALLQRTPPWLTEDDFAQMQAMYDLAAKKSQEDGIVWHVDHIIPLQGKTISGLHVPSNLQLLSATENMRKGNRFYG
jgi:hypothetical protein